MTLRKIARTNAPRTCLYCGQKLRRIDTSVERKLTWEEYCLFIDSDQRQIPRAQWPKIDGHRVLYLSTHNGTHAALRVATEEYGDGGWFCTGACAAHFGRAAASLNFRLNPRTES